MRVDNDRAHAGVDTEKISSKGLQSGFVTACPFCQSTKVVATGPNAPRAH